MLHFQADLTRSEYQRVTPESAGWEMLHFGARRLLAGEGYEWDTGENELALIVLGGKCSVRSSRGEWDEVGWRPHVFGGMPYALYLPRRTQFTVEAHSTELDIAYGWCATDENHPARLIRPEEVEIEIRGGGNEPRSRSFSASC